MKRIIICDGLGLELFTKLYNLIHKNDKLACLDWFKLQFEAEKAAKWYGDEDMPHDMVLSFGLHKYDTIVYPYQADDIFFDEVECGDMFEVYHFMPFETRNLPF